MSARLSWLKILGDLVQFSRLCFRSKISLAAENLFLRKQLAFYQERRIKPRRADNPTRLTLVLLSRWFDWRNALTVVANTFRTDTYCTAFCQMNSPHTGIRRAKAR